MWTKEESQKWKANHANKCVDCGGACAYTAKRCMKCHSAHRRTRKQRYCLDCNKPINLTKDGDISGNKAVRCKHCAIKHRWDNGELRAAHNRIKGINHPLRKSLTRKHEGYILVYKPEHPRARKGQGDTGMVFQHILVWEETHGKHLPDGWIIHHLNGIKDDNRPTNLAGLPGRKHYHVLAAKAKRIQELEALLKNQRQLL